MTRRKPPHGVSVLQRWITDVQRTTGVAPARQQRWVSFMVLAAMLERVRADDGQPIFLVKGGLAMELRVGGRARATKDLDLAARAEPDALVTRLDDALAAGHGDFTATRTDIEPVRETGALRTTVKLQYRSRAWASVPVELSPTEAGIADEIERLPAKPLDHLGLDGPDEIPAVAVRWQLAQKLHACTEPETDGRPNDRFRDLIDILLLWDLVTPADRPAVRDACMEVFAGRGAHPWPPQLDPPSHWADGYRTLATDMAFPLDDVDEAASAVRAIIDQLDGTPDP